MKKYCFVVLTALCLLLCMTIAASAAVDPSPDIAADDISDAETSAFQRLVNMALYSIIPLFASLTSPMGAFALVPYILIIAALVYFSLFGYRFYIPIRITLGALAGFFIGYVGWHILIHGINTPTFILNHELLFYVLTLVFSPIIGGVVAFFLRRVGIALSVTAISSVLISPVLLNPIFYWCAVALVLVLSLLVTKTSVVLLTSFACPIFALFLLFGPNGFYPVAFLKVLSSVVEPVVLIGLVVGFVCMFAQRKICRAYR